MLVNELTLTMPARDFSGYSDRCTRELTSKRRYYTMTTSTLCWGCNSLLAIENKYGMEKNYKRWYKQRSDNGTKKGRVDH